MSSNNNSSKTDVQAENQDTPTSVVDMTKYEPVRIEAADLPYEHDAPETSIPVGRKRVPTDTVFGDDAGIEIPHEDCDHILVEGLPQRRQGSILASIGKNLKDEHGYSYVSIHDDGRMETPMLAVPNDDRSARDSLEAFDQEPAGMDTEVFIPATGNLPEQLPRNFTQFTIGIDVVSDDHREDLAETGVLSQPDTETAIDMESVLADQDRAAVLCCNFLRKEQTGLKYTIMAEWLRLVYKARDENPRLPRVCLEARWLNDLAPAQVHHSAYPDRVKALRQTVQQIAVQGGSRRILLLGCTNSATEIHRPVRENMPTRIVVQASEETIDKLDRTYTLSSEQKHALATFNSGIGMLIADGELHWPIEFRPAPCGTGSGDMQWLDRYGRAWGARVRTNATDGFDEDWLVSLSDASSYTGKEPEIGEWYLASSDFAAETTPADVDQDDIESVLEARRSNAVQSDLSLTSTADL